MKHLARTALAAFVAFATVVLVALIFDPFRWLIHPDAAIDLELRRLRGAARESLRLERDKRMHAFEARGKSHAEYLGGGFNPAAYRASIAV